MILGDRDVLNARAAALGLEVTLPDWAPGQPAPAGAALWHCPAGAAVTAGRPDPATGAGTLAMLQRAADGCLDGTFSAMVTAPVAKNVICESADPTFTGHTEFLAERAGVDRVVMMLVAGDLRVALATTHLPLADVPAAITAAGLSRVLTILRDDLRAKFALPRPRILVLGLNPTPAKAATWAARSWTSSSPPWNACAARASTSPARCPRTPPSSRRCWSNTTRCWPCTTTRACRCSSTPASARR